MCVSIRLLPLTRTILSSKSAIESKFAVRYHITTGTYCNLSIVPRGNVSKFRLPSPINMIFYLLDICVYPIFPSSRSKGPIDRQSCTNPWKINKINNVLVKLITLNNIRHFLTMSSYRNNWFDIICPYVRDNACMPPIELSTGV